MYPPAILSCLVLVLCGACAPPMAASPDLGAANDLSCVDKRVIEDLVFPSTDGLMVHATATRPCGGARAPWVVLAHQLCSDRSEWIQANHDWVSALLSRNVATLAIDLRGHGASTSWPDGSTHDLCGEATDTSVTPLYLGMPGDVQAAMSYARSTLGASAVAVIGASIGSNSAVVAFASDPQATMVVALSPGLDYKGIKTSEPVKAIGSRPALLEAADDDPSSAASVRQLATLNASIATKIWPTGGHANRILTAHPEELARIADLVVATLSAP